MTKTGCHFFTAVDTGERLILFVTTQLQCFFNKRCEIFLLVNMDSSREGNHFCCKYSVSVAAFWRHQTVGSVEDRGRKMVKLFLLILPCSSEIAFQVSVFL